MNQQSDELTIGREVRIRSTASKGVIHSAPITGDPSGIWYFVDADDSLVIKPHRKEDIEAL